MSKGRRGKELTEEQRTDAARRVLAGQLTIEAACAELDVVPQTVKAWMKRLEHHERSAIMDRLWITLSTLYWVDRARFEEAVKQVEGVLAEDVRKEEEARAARAREYQLKQERERVRIEGRARLTVIDGGAP
jgi:transposase-like protein